MTPRLSVCCSSSPLQAAVNKGRKIILLMLCLMHNSYQLSSASGDCRHMRGNSFILLLHSSLPCFLRHSHQAQVSTTCISMQEQSITLYESTTGYNQYYCMELPRGCSTEILLTSLPKPSQVTQQVKNIHIKYKVASSSFCCNMFLDMLFILLTT